MDLDEAESESSISSLKTKHCVVSPGLQIGNKANRGIHDEANKNSELERQLLELRAQIADMKVTQPQKQSDDSFWLAKQSEWERILFSRDMQYQKELGELAAQHKAALETIHGQAQHEEIQNDHLRLQQLAAEEREKQLHDKIYHQNASFAEIQQQLQHETERKKAELEQRIQFQQYQKQAELEQQTLERKQVLFEQKEIEQKQALLELAQAKAQLEWQEKQRVQAEVDQPMHLEQKQAELKREEMEQKQRAQADLDQHVQMEQKQALLNWKAMEQKHALLEQQAQARAQAELERQEKYCEQAELDRHVQMEQKQALINRKEMEQKQALLEHHALAQLEWQEKRREEAELDGHVVLVQQQAVFGDLLELSKQNKPGKNDIQAMHGKGKGDPLLEEPMEESKYDNDEFQFGAKPKKKSANSKQHTARRGITKDTSSVGSVSFLNEVTDASARSSIGLEEFVTPQSTKSIISNSTPFFFSPMPGIDGMDEVESMDTKQKANKPSTPVSGRILRSALKSPILPAAKSEEKNVKKVTLITKRKETDDSIERRRETDDSIDSDDSNSSQESSSTMSSIRTNVDPKYFGQEIPDYKVLKTKSKKPLGRTRLMTSTTYKP